jgi:hypothetical protein
MEIDASLPLDEISGLTGSFEAVLPIELDEKER